MNASVAIVGTGLSGLSCGRRLAASGIGVAFFEKSRSLCGRCATRKWNGHIVDHGAQFFTIRSAAFRAELDELCPGRIAVLDAPILDARGEAIAPEEARRYHVAGNNRIGRALLGALPVRMETSIERLAPVGERWRVEGQPFDAVVSCAPWPQSARLFGMEEGESVYVPCLTALLEYEGDWAGRSRECYARTGADALLWSACENHKGGRILPGRTVFVAQASPEFSEEHLEDDPERWLAPLRDRLEAKWEVPAADRSGHMTHRWRFARAVRTVTETPAPGLFLTGDSRVESRVESAWLCGRETAADVLGFLEAR